MWLESARAMMQATIGEFHFGLHWNTNVLARFILTTLLTCDKQFAGRAMKSRFLSVRYRRNLNYVYSFMVVMVVTLGCNNLVPRAQSPDLTSMKYSKKVEETLYVGNIAAPWGLNMAQVEGIALVNRLIGTGSNPPVTDSRQHLVNEMQSYGVTDIDAYLAGTDNSLVLVKGFLPPAAQKGDTFDLFVITPTRSETTSLEQGFLMQSRLRPMAVLGGRVKEGNTVGLGTGSVVVNEVFTPSTGDGGKLQAIVPGGGTVTEPRPVGLAIQKQSQSVKNSAAIAKAINNRFTTMDVNARIGVANPKNDKLVEIQVPVEYKFNVTRFFRVLASTAINESSADRLERIQRIEREFHEPGMANISALRLESIGRDALPSLRRALRSDDQEVRFHAAQAITYIGETDGVEELERVARGERAFRWHALTALASCTRKPAEDALVRLLDVSSVETRYGAYRALLQRSKDEPIYHGKMLNRNFYFVILPTAGEPMIHVAKKHRREIVLFGTGHKLDQNFLYVEQGLTIKALNPDTVEIIRYLPGQPEVRITCPTDLEMLIPRLAKYGCDYGTVIKVLKEAQASRSLNTKFVINALPERNREYDRNRSLVAANSYDDDVDLEESLPTMFDTASLDSNANPRTAQISTKGTVDSELNEEANAAKSDLRTKRKSWSIIPSIFR